MKSKKQINRDKRFIEIRDNLIKEGKVKNKKQFADIVNSYSGVIAEINKEDGKRGMTLDMLEALFEIGISPNYFFGFENGLNNIIYLTEANAGNSIPTEATRDFEGFKIPGLTGNLWAFIVKGESMEPTLLNGELLICEEVQDKNELKNDKIYVFISNDGVNVKRIKLKKKNNQTIGIILISDNPIFEKNHNIDFTYGLHDFPYIQIFRPIRRITKSGL